MTVRGVLGIRIRGELAGWLEKTEGFGGGDGNGIGEGNGMVKAERGRSGCGNNMCIL